MLINFGEIHAIGKLQPRDLPRVKLNFQVGAQDGDVNGFALRRALALGADAVEFQVTIMRFHEFVYDRIHSFYILQPASISTNRSKTLEASLVPSSEVTLLA